MSSRTLELANALAAWIASLHASTPFPAAIVPQVLWVHKYDKKDLAAVKFSVVPGPIEMQPLGRSNSSQGGGQRIRHKREIDLVTQQNVDPSDQADVDPLVELQEQLVERLVGGSVACGIWNAVCTAAEMITADKAAVDKSELQNLRVFTAVLRTSWSFRQ